MASPYDILIEIQAKAQEVSQATAAIQAMVDKATASGPALAGGMQQGQQAAQALTQAATGAGAALASGMDGGAKSATNAGAAVKKVKDATDEASKGAGSLREMFEQAFAFGIGNQIVDRVLEIPTRLIESFGEAIRSGIEFNSEMERLGIGIAGSLRQADPEHILNFAQAQAAGSQALDLLRVKANQLGLDLHGLAETFQINLRAMTEGGVKSMEDQINLVLLLSQAAASKGLSGFQAQRDIIDLLNGKGDRTIFSKELGVTDDDIKQATQAGQLYQFLADKLSAYGEAGNAAADTFGAASQRLHNEVEQLEGAVTKPLFDVLKKSANDLAATLGTADFQAKFSVIAQQIAQAATVAITFGAALVPMIPAIIQTTTAVVALAVALGTGGLITAMGGAVTEAGSLATALAPVGLRITAMLTALGPAGAIIGAAAAIMLVFENRIASFQAQAQKLLNMANQFGTVIGGIDKQIAEANTPEKQAAAYAKLNQQFTDLVTTREALKRQGTGVDADELKAVNDQILQVQARLKDFQNQAGKGAQTAQSTAAASQYPTTVKAITDEDEQQREANMSKEDAHAEAVQGYDQARLAAAKALGLENDASYDRIKQGMYGVMQGQNDIAQHKPELIDTSTLDAQVNDVKRQLEEVRTKVLQAQQTSQEASKGSYNVTPSKVDPNYDANIQTAEDLTGQLNDAMRALAAAKAQNAQADREGTSTTRESNAAAVQILATFQQLQKARANMQATEKSATTEQLQLERQQVQEQLDRAKLAAGPNNMTSDVQDLMVRTKELALQQEYLRQNGKLDDEHLKLAHDIAVAEVGVTVAKKDGAAASKEAAKAVRDERMEDTAADKDRKNSLQQIKDQLADIKGDPFLTDAQKIPQELRLLQQEREQLLANIKARQDYINAHQGDPSAAVKSSAMQGENVQDQRSLTQNSQQTALLTGGGQIKSQLVQLQNEWAVTSQTIGKSITQNIQTAVDSVSNAIDDLIMNTHNWRQAFAQAGSAIIKNLIQLGVQMVVNAVLGKTLSKTAASSQAADSATITAAAAPAAAVTSVSSYGVAAIVGAALAVAAIAAIIAMATSHAEGGIIPGRPSHKDNRMAHVASGEYVVRTAAVQHYGPDFFHRLNSMSMPRTGFASGGLVGDRDGYTPILATVGGGAPNVNVGGSRLTLIQTRDRSEMLQALQSAEGKKIVLGHVKRNRTDVGIRS